MGKRRVARLVINGHRTSEGGSSETTPPYLVSSLVGQGIPWPMNSRLFMKGTRKVMSPPGTPVWRPAHTGFH
jgi:hypothetical protein